LAKPFENEKLHFEVRDLRDLQLNQQFDIALNLFTSFAYFDDYEADVKVLKEIKQILKPGGFLLIDFFNAQKVVESLVPYEEKEKDRILFKLSKKIEDGKIIKGICFEHYGHSYHFEEKVQALNLADFEKLFEESGFKLIEKFGSYDLSSFEVQNSDRLILIAQSTHVG
jgi:SAM-dependent methyltransferase